MTLPQDRSDLRLAAPLSLDVKANAEGHIEGYASTFGGEPDRHGEIITKGAFGRTIREHKAQGSMPAMLWSHQLETPIGRWTTIQEDSAGLFVAGSVNLKSTAGRDAFEHIRSGDVGALSIGFTVPEGKRRYLGKGAFVIDEIDLAEISIVSVPANRHARITTTKHLSTKSEAVTFLREAGLSKAAAQRFAAGGFSALAHEGIDTDRAMKLAEAMERATKAIRGNAR